MPTEKTKAHTQKEYRERKKCKCYNKFLKSKSIICYFCRMSLNEVFSSLESSKNPIVRDESRRPDHVIQKYVILDEIPTLMAKIEEWIEEEMLPTTFLRFLAHLVLFFDQVGKGHNRDISEKVLEL